MKIALISPAGAMHRFNGSFALPLHYSPLTLTTLAALVPEELSATVEIYDETVEALPLDLEADLVGITTITGTSMRAYRLADYFRSKNIPVVLGGPHPTLLPEEAMKHAASVVVGYAEESWPRLLKDFSNGNLQKKYTMKADFNLINRPIPKRNLLKKRKYITTNSMEIARGCYHNCRFCVIPTAWGRNLVKRPIPEVIQELEKLPGKRVIFVDANLIADPSYSKKLFKEMIPLKKEWFGLVTFNITKDPELFSLFVKSGCKGVLIGFESVFADSLKSINKSFHKVQEYETLMKQLHGAGIGVNGTFAFGSDEEDKDVFKRTVEMILKLKIDLPRYSVLTPFPRTPLYQQLEKEKRIIHRDWSLYDVEHCVYQPKKMTPEELEEGLHLAWKETYSHLNILKRTCSLSSRFLFNIPINLGYRHYATKLPKFTHQVMMDHSDIPHVPSKKKT